MFLISYEKIQSLGRRGINAKKVVDYLYKRPVIDAENIRKITGLSSPSSYKLISDLENLDILKEITGSQRGRRYVFEQYLKLFR
jgi:Fic family protein